MKKILLLNGPNLNLLSIRDVKVYGSKTLDSIEKECVEFAKNKGYSLIAKQSNHEGELIDLIHLANKKQFIGIVINAGAYAHYSYAIRDAIDSVKIPIIDVHISDIYAREEFRRVDVLKEVCADSVIGKGTGGYIEAIDLLISKYAK